MIFSTDVTREWALRKINDGDFTPWQKPSIPLIIDNIGSVQIYVSGENSEDDEDDIETGLQITVFLAKRHDIKFFNQKHANLTASVTSFDFDILTVIDELIELAMEMQLLALQKASG